MANGNRNFKLFTLYIDGDGGIVRGVGVCGVAAVHAAVVGLRPQYSQAGLCTPYILQQLSIIEII